MARRGHGAGAPDARGYARVQRDLAAHVHLIWSPMRRATLGSLVVVSSLAVATLAVGLPSDAATPALPVAATTAAPTVGKPLGGAAVAIARQHVAAHEAEFGLT